MPFVVLALLGVLILLPMGYLIFGAMRTGAPGQAGAAFTLDHLWTVYGTAKYLEALKNTLLLAALTTLFAAPIGVGFAWLVARSDLRGKRMIEVLVVAPLFISPLLGSLAWIALAAPNAGFLNSWVGRGLLGLESDMLDIYSMFGIVLVMVLYYVPNIFLFTVGSFHKIDSSLEDSARIAGAGPAKVWMKVTAPLVLPAILSSMLLVFVLAAEQFAVPTLLGVRGNFETIPLLLYQGFEYGAISPGEVAALATQLVTVTLIGIFLYRRVVRVSKKYVTITGKGGRARDVRLGRARPLAYALVGLYGLLAVILPVLALIVGSLQSYLTSKFDVSIWTLDNYRRFVSAGAVEMILNTLILAVGGAAVTVLIAFLAGYVITRERNPLTAFLDYASSLPIAIPGIAMAIGLLWAYTSLPVGVYGTIGLLLIACVGRFIGHGVRIASTSFAQVDGDLEGAGRVAGLTRSGVLWRISFGLVRPSVVSAWMMIFIFIVVEVATVIVLYTPTTAPLSVGMWNAMEMSGSVGGFTIGVVQIALVLLVLFAMYFLSGPRLGYENEDSR